MLFGQTPSNRSALDEVSKASEDFQRSINTLFDAYCDPDTETEQFVNHWEALAGARDRLMEEVHKMSAKMSDQRLESFFLGIVTGLKARLRNSDQTNGESIQAQDKLSRLT